MDVLLDRELPTLLLLVWLLLTTTTLTLVPGVASPRGATVSVSAAGLAKTPPAALGTACAVTRGADGACRRTSTATLSARRSQLGSSLSAAAVNS